MRASPMFSSWPVSALVAGVKLGAGNSSDARVPRGLAVDRERSVAEMRCRIRADCLANARIAYVLVVARRLFGRGREDGRGQLFRLAQAFGQPVAADFARREIILPARSREV